MTTPKERMSDERCKVIAAHLEQHGMLPEEYAEEVLAEIDALRAELTAARTVEGGEVQRHVKWLLTGCVDWDGSRMVDGEIPKGEIKCGDFRQIADLLTRLSSAKAEAERNATQAFQAGVAHQERANTAERERDEARAALAQARADALEEAAKWHDQRADYTPDAMAIGIHRRSAAAIRALKPTPTQDR